MQYHFHVIYVSVFCPSYLFLDGSRDSCHTGDSEAPTHLREQQHSPQYWQHTEHTLLQQQHSLAQHVT